MSKKIVTILCLIFAVCSIHVFAQNKNSGLLRIEQNGKTGYIDKTGKIVITPRFDDGWEFSEGFACIVENGKTGFIDESGKYLAAPQFNNFSYGCYDNFSEGLVSFSVGDAQKGEEEKWGFLDAKGGITFLPGVTFLSDFREGLAFFKKDGLTGYLDKDLNVAVEPKFKSAGDFYFGRARAEGLDGSEFYIDKTGRKLFDNHDGGEFQDAKAFFKLGGKYGFINLDGEIIVEPRFEDATHFGENLAGVKVGKKWGFIDETGKLIIKPQFDQVGVFQEGLASVMVKGKYGFIDRTGKIVIRPQFDVWTYWFENGICQIRLDGKTGYIDRQGKYIWEPTK